MNSKAPVKAVIFDLGGVIARIDFHRPFLGIGCFTAQEKLNESFQKSLLEKAFAYETGKIETESFLREVQEMIQKENPYLPENVPGLETIKDIWNSMITELPAENLALIARVRTKFRTCLLSNTNDLHIRYVESLHPGVKPSFTEVFDKIYCSHQLGLHKPDTDIYRHVCHDLGLPPEECLFIDDRSENIAGAQKTGMKSWLLSDFDLHRLFTKAGGLSPWLLDLL